MDDISDANLVSDDSGFGLIEIVISMFLLGLLAIAFLPLLATSLQTAVRISTVATAAQLLDQEMGLARSVGDTCSAVMAFGADSPLAATTDIRGTSYQPARTVVSCASVTSYPTTVSVSVTVSVTASGSSYSPLTATTLIYLKAP